MIDGDDIVSSVTDAVSDSFTETTHTSWLSRLGDSIKGVLFGIVLLVVSGVLLFWNEGRAVTTDRSLAEGKGAVVRVDPGRVDPANEGKLIYLSGEVKTRGRIADADFGVSTDGVKLARRVEMFQWKEEKHTESKKNLGGSEDTTTTYTYTQVWSDKPLESGGFRKPEGHRNPAMRFKSGELVARDATLGAFRPGQEALSELDATQALAIDDAFVSSLRGRVSGPARAIEGKLYLGENPDKPRVGDTRVTFTVAPQGPASMIGRQSGAAVTPYQTQAGDRLLMVESGERSPEVMFKHAADENRFLTWALRLAGVVVMWIAFTLFLRPLVIVGDIVPVIGDILGAGAGIVSGLITALVAPLIIAFAWLWYRPLVSIIAVAIGIVAAFFLKKAAAARAAARPKPAVAAGPQGGAPGGAPGGLQGGAPPAA